MAYRSDEQAHHEQIQHLERELAEVRARQRRLRQELTEARRLQRHVEARLAEAGPGGGRRRGGRRDRIDVAAALLVLVGLPLVYFHVDWQRYITQDATVIPAIIWLGTPGLLAAILCWPYRRRGRRFVVIGLCGLLLAALPALNLVLA